jgi:DNA polymerase-4
MMRAVISHLSEQVTRRLRRNGRFARSVTVKYRCDDFRTFAQTRSFSQPTEATDPVFRTAMVLLNELKQKHPQPIRLLGVSVGNLTSEGTRQLDLFESETDDQSQKAVDKVVDQLSDQIGKNSVYRATSHSWINRTEKPKNQ